MFERFHAWLARHPLLRDVLLWSVPALLIGAALRIILIYTSPYAFWGADSRSFMGFTNGVLTDNYWSINEKRRYLYPIFLLPISLLPGGTLRWLAWIQAGLGLASILPLAYMVRRVFAGWKAWIVPVTVLYAGMPVFMWFEHELIAESVFFQCMVWTMGGWVAWVTQKDAGRARLLWWWFWVPFAIMLLTKPSGKMLWPGLVIGLLLVGAWRVLKWPQWGALIALFCAGATVGADNQGSWLLYTSSFPLTRLDTPLHAEYKAEIREWVQLKRDRITLYDEEDDEVHDFLRSPEMRPEFSRWNKLSKKERDKLYKELALEGIKARPDLFLLIALQRLAGSTNQSDFKTVRFDPYYYADYLRKMYYESGVEESMMRIVFGIPRNAPYPSYEEMRTWVSPRPDSFWTKFYKQYADAFQVYGDLLHRPYRQQTELLDMRITPLGWLAILGGILSLFGAFRRPLGVWTLTFGGYLVAVYLVGVEHHRYFALVWPFILVLFAVVPETLWLAWQRWRPSSR
jgi:hypothetical protein